MKLMPTELDLTNYKQPITIENVTNEIVKFRLETEEWPTKIEVNSEQFKRLLFIHPDYNVEVTKIAIRGIPVEMRMPHDQR